MLFYVAIESLYRCVNTVFNAGKSVLPSFLGTYNLSMSSLEFNALCMVISFLILWSICFSSSLVHFKKGPEYLTRSTAQVFIPLIRFPLQCFVSRSFLVLLRYFFFVFSFISTCLMASASKVPKYLYVLYFSERSNLYLAVSFRPSGVICHLSFLAWHIFLYQNPSLWPGCIFLLRILEFPVLLYYFSVIYWWV